MANNIKAGMKKTSVILLISTAITGLAIAWIDARPNWDDTGISVLMIFVTATIFGYFTSQKPWQTALTISIWIPLYGIASTQNWGSLLAFIPGFAGAYLGFNLIRKFK